MTKNEFSSDWNKEETLEDIKAKLGKSELVWNEGFYREDGTMLDVDKSEKTPELAPSLAWEESLAWGVEHEVTLHYYLEFGVPSKEKFFAYIDGKYYSFHIKELDFPVLIGESECTSQLFLIGWAFDAAFNDLDKLKCYLKKIQ